MAERTTSASAASISRSLAPLRDVVASLSAASEGAQPTANDRRRLVRRVRAAGSSALPALLRALTSGHEGEARWAAYLLQRVGPAERPRVAERVSRMLEDPRLGPAERARAESLLDALVDVGLEIPEAIEALGEHADEIHALCDQIDRLERLEQRGRGPLDGIAEAIADATADAAAEVGLDEAFEVPLDRELPEPCQRTTAAALRPLELLPRDADAPAAASPSTSDGSDETGRRDRPRRIVRRDPRRTGFQLLERGDLRGARRALREAVTADPDDGEALSYLGVCLLQLGEAEEALTHLTRACDLHPEEALHHWNVASAAKATDRLCRGYVALQQYLALEDSFDGHEARRREAERFLETYRKLIDTMHPGIPLGAVLDGEERFQAALAALSARRFEEAAAGFREVLAVLPRHYPSWGNLGAAEIALGRTDEARACLRRALELKPDYDVAHDNLALIETRH